MTKIRPSQEYEKIRYLLAVSWIWSTYLVWKISYLICLGRNIWVGKIPLYTPFLDSDVFLSVRCKTGALGIGVRAV